ncbi:MAG TPA: hypothetical protein VMH86_17180 [Rhizomicrobium sp.]|nr:hypothetical protein [Rhizomicrobium sp.]
MNGYGRRGNWFQQQRLGLTLVGAVFAAALLPVLYMVFDTQAPPPVDSSNCLLDRPPVSHTVVLVDGTDKLEKNQADVVLAVVANEAHAVPPYGKITIATIDQDHPYTPRILFTSCAPKNRQDADWLSENPEVFGTFWQQKFDRPLMLAAQQSAMTDGQKSTPLVESIFGLSLRTDFDSDVKNRRLVIVSDMLQNTELYTHYKGVPGFAAFLQRKDAFQDVPNLKGVTVVARYLIRPQSMQYQSEAQKQFWRDYFDATQAEVKIEGWPWRTLKEWHAAVVAAQPAPGHAVRHRRRKSADEASNGGATRP